MSKVTILFGTIETPAWVWWTDATPRPANENGSFKSPGMPLKGKEIEKFWYDEAQEIDENDFKCPACHGRGTVNPLSSSKSLPKDFVCFGVTDCPCCDGSGKI